MTGPRLVEEVLRLAANPQTLQAMGRAARKFARPGAAKRAADILESLLTAR
jgi:UDP-N-acetylglucosamine:LPS N-acetylglucosamine transferase